METKGETPEASAMMSRRRSASRGHTSLRHLPSSGELKAEAPPPHQGTGGGGSGSGAWVEAAHEGRVYWYNEVTGESTYSRPESLDTFHWVEDVDEGFVAGKLLWGGGGSGGSSVFEIRGTGASMNVGDAAIGPRIDDPGALDRAMSDMVHMSEVNVPFVLHNLRQRFFNDDFMTNVGDILISVNPFKWLQHLYTLEVARQYQKWDVGDDDLPPHIFSVAAAVHKSMIADARGQSVIISGESGSGKVRTTTSASTRRHAVCCSVFCRVLPHVVLCCLRGAGIGGPVACSLPHVYDARI